MCFSVETTRMVNAVDECGESRPCCETRDLIGIDLDTCAICRYTRLEGKGSLRVLVAA